MDRRHCNLKWQSRVLAIRQKIDAAIQDMPENEEIKQLLAGACEWGWGSGCPRGGGTRGWVLHPEPVPEGFGHGNLPLAEEEVGGRWLSWSSLG